MSSRSSTSYSKLCTHSVFLFGILTTRRFNNEDKGHFTHCLDRSTLWVFYLLYFHGPFTIHIHGVVQVLFYILVLFYAQPSLRYKPNKHKVFLFPWFFRKLVHRSENSMTSTDYDDGSESIWSEILRADCGRSFMCGFSFPLRFFPFVQKLDWIQYNVQLQSFFNGLNLMKVSSSCHVIIDLWEFETVRYDFQLVIAYLHTLSILSDTMLAIYHVQMPVDNHFPEANMSRVFSIVW